MWEGPVHGEWCPGWGGSRANVRKVTEQAMRSKQMKFLSASSLAPASSFCPDLDDGPISCKMK